MSIMMKAFTSQNDAEIKTCIKMLMDTDAGTGFMHESFNKNDPKNFTLHGLHGRIRCSES